MAKMKPMATADKKQGKEKGKVDMKAKNGPAAVAMKARGTVPTALAERTNPSEVIWSRRKFNVLGKKHNGEEGRTSRPRLEAIHKRESSLLKDFELSAKPSVFNDQRIGKRDETLLELDKTILLQQHDHMAPKAKEMEEEDSDCCSFIPKQLNPKFEDNYIKGIDYDPDRERAQLKKLKGRSLSEKKWAVLKVHQENHFPAAVEDKEKRKQEQVEKLRRMMDFLEEQERAFKSGQLGKGKKRRK